jgi:DNA replication protein DnaC
MTTATITDRSALGAALRQLNLSGMLDTLDARLAQARAGELGHLDFLQVLCQDEISRRETTSLHRRIRAARFETPATLEGFDFAVSPKLPAAQIRDLAALRWLQSGESLILYGPVGVGKSHVAQALAHLAIRSGADARFMKTSRALAHLAGGHADRTWDKRLRELTRPAVVVLDDFAMREFTAAQADDLYDYADRAIMPTGSSAPGVLPGQLRWRPDPDRHNPGAWLSLVLSMLERGVGHGQATRKSPGAAGPACGCLRGGACKARLCGALGGGAPVPAGTAQPVAGSDAARSGGAGPGAGGPVPALEPC